MAKDHGRSSVDVTNTGMRMAAEVLIRSGDRSSRSPSRAMNRTRPIRPEAYATSSHWLWGEYVPAIGITPI
jgi:hypothetical protein